MTRDAGRASPTSHAVPEDTRADGRPRPTAVAGIVLAAGAGTRFGMPKALAAFHGERLVDRAVSTLLSGGCGQVFVVAGAADLGEIAGATVVANPQWQEGMGSSLKAGLTAAGSAEAVVVLLVDQPLIDPEAVRRLIAAAADPDTASGLAVATYHGRRAHPVLFRGTVLPDLIATLHGDTGARAYLAAHEDDLIRVDCTGVGRPDDVDTPEALAALERLA